MKNRQKLLNLLFENGIGVTGGHLDKVLKENNNHEMSLSNRINWCLNNFDKCKDWFK